MIKNTAMRGVALSNDTLSKMPLNHFIKNIDFIDHNVIFNEVMLLIFFNKVTKIFMK
jgi:hypothetical protein